MKPLRTSVDKLIKTRPKRTPGRSNPEFRDWYDRSEGNFLESEPDSRTEEHPRYTKERASLCGRPVRPDGVPDSQGRTLHEIYPDSRTAALVILQVANKFADRTFAEANSIYEGFLKENGASKGSGNGRRESSEFRALCNVLAEEVLLATNFDPEKEGAASWLWKHLFPIAYAYIREERSPLTGLSNYKLRNPSYSPPAGVCFEEETHEGGDTQGLGVGSIYCCLPNAPFSGASLEDT